VREIILDIDGFPPAKNEALSMLGMKHSHAPRVRALLEAARREISSKGFAVFEGPIGLDVELHAPPDRDPWDATNYLGGIGDVLEVKARRGVLDHLGGLAAVGLYLNDRQIREVRYRQLPAEHARYRVRIWMLEDDAGAAHAESRGSRNGGSDVPR
jgi:hypothetical protein